MKRGTLEARVLERPRHASWRSARRHVRAALRETRDDETEATVYLQWVRGGNADGIPSHTAEVAVGADQVRSYSELVAMIEFAGTKRCPKCGEVDHETDAELVPTDGVERRIVETVAILRQVRGKAA